MQRLVLDRKFAACKHTLFTVRLLQVGFRGVHIGLKKVVKFAFLHHIGLLDERRRRVKVLGERIEVYCLRSEMKEEEGEGTEKQRTKEMDGVEVC
jgi:hypothetical protein